MPAPIEAYPLAWPDGWPRRKAWVRKPSAYQVEFATARDELLRELRLMGASNVPLRRDGLPLANMRQPEDPGVAVYWTDAKRMPRVIACDVWRTVRENLRAVGIAIESIRSLERTGASEILERAFAGFARLPASSDHWGVLGISKSTRAALDARYRELALQHHPDRGGDPTIMAAINAAYASAVAEL